MSHIDLGRKYSSPSPVKENKSTEPKISYQTLYVSGVDSLKDLPSGEFNFTGKGKVVSKTERTSDGKTDCSCEIEVHSIEPKSSKTSKSSSEGLAEALTPATDDMEMDDDEE